MIELILALVMSVSSPAVKPIEVQVAQVEVILSEQPWVEAVDEPVTSRYNVWQRLAECESNGEWHYNPSEATWGNRLFEGGLQFHPSTWDAYAPAGYPDAAYKASMEQQVAVAELVLQAQGFNAWPTCARKLGLIG